MSHVRKPLYEDFNDLQLNEKSIAFISGEGEMENNTAIMQDVPGAVRGVSD